MVTQWGYYRNSVTVYPTSKGITLLEFLRKTSLALKKAVPNEQWIRAEISQYRVFNSGHVSVERVEHNEMGQLAARIQSFIWASNVQRVVGQFVAGTGGPLTTGLKVMVKASIDLTPTNNLRLVITDIDPYMDSSIIAR
jgi:exodeoxyribonuclease VII large subunit